MVFDPILNTLRAGWRRVARPPYAGLPWLIVLYVITACLIYTANGPFTGHVVGFDDQVRMTQVLELVNGKGWYDRVIHRVDPPEGFQTIWTRLVDIPLALVVLAAQLVVDQRTAALVAVTVVPLVSLILLFYLMRWFARPLVGKRDSWLVLLFVMFTPILNKKPITLAGFHLGEASHHSWYVILNVLMFGAATRLALGVGGRKPVGLLALGVGLMVAVGIEGFPMIAGICGILAGLAWYFESPRLARHSAEALGLGTLLTLILLPMQWPPARWFEITFAQTSILGSILVGAAAIFLTFEFALLHAMPQGRRVLTAIILLAAAAGTGGVLVFFFPDILNGAAAALSPEERVLAFNNHPEAFTMWRESSGIIDYIGLAMPSFIAIGAGIVAVRRTRSRRRRVMFLAFLGCAALGGGMAQLFWRYVHHAMTAACVWLLWAWQKLNARLQPGRYYALAAFGLFVMLGPFWMLILSALNEDSPFLTQVAFYPAKVYATPYACDPLTFADYLNTHYGPQTNLIVPDGDSAQFTYYTNVTIDFLSNYPSHNHFIDNLAFFRATDPDAARDIAWRHKIDLVAICKILPASPAFLASRPYRQTLFMETLIYGPLPAWLRPVPTYTDTLFQLYAVDHAELAREETGRAKP